MKKLKILDAYCGDGGASMGYYQAGFDEIVGIDVTPHPRYPFKFIQADAIEYITEHGHGYDAIHTSPPCQHYSPSTRQWRKAGYVYVDLVDMTRTVLVSLGLPYVIENVMDAPLLNPVVLYGEMFGINIRRDRKFETNFPLPLVGPPLVRQRPIKMGRKPQAEDVVQPAGHFSGVEYVKQQMGINWMTSAGLSQAIPPCYTKC